ncbi:MAG: hypothetical protein WD827_00210 [Solirubrobacterales bacterium]
MDELTGAEPPGFEIGQAVLVDEGLPGEITAVERGTVPGVQGVIPPVDTWLYTVEPEDGSELQTDVPEYNLVDRKAWEDQGDY